MREVHSVLPNSPRNLFFSYVTWIESNVDFCFPNCPPGIPSLVLPTEFPLQHPVPESVSLAQSLAQL